MQGKGTLPLSLHQPCSQPLVWQGREIRLPTVKTCYGMLLGFSEQELKWQDWSLEREQERKRMHDNFLLERLGPLPYQFPWAEWFRYSILGTKNLTRSRRNARSLAIMAFRTYA